MGKKSRSPKSTCNNVITATSTPSAPAASRAVPTTYPSDGPSEEELACVQTTSRFLQAKLNQLVEFIVSNGQAGFAAHFASLDLSPHDAAGYLQDLTTAPEAEGQWKNLAAEIVTIPVGSGVTTIKGNQETNAVFFFEHPLLEGCDREVAPDCISDTWRAEG